MHSNFTEPGLLFSWDNWKGLTCHVKWCYLTSTNFWLVLTLVCPKMLSVVKCVNDHFVFLHRQASKGVALINQGRGIDIFPFERCLHHHLPTLVFLSTEDTREHKGRNCYTKDLIDFMHVTSPVENLPLRFVCRNSLQAFGNSREAVLMAIFFLDLLLREYGSLQISQFHTS